MAWPTDRTDKLKALHAEGLSYELIARAIGGGVTKNMCIGRAKRLGLVTPAQRRTPQHQIVPRAAVRVVADDPIGCLYPLDDRACGKARLITSSDRRSSYCPVHHRLCCRRPKPLHAAFIAHLVNA